MNPKDYFTAGTPKKSFHLAKGDPSRRYRVIFPAITILAIGIFAAGFSAVVFNFMDSRAALLAAMNSVGLVSSPVDEPEAEAPIAGSPGAVSQGGAGASGSGAATNAEPTPSANEPVIAAPLQPAPPAAPQKPYRELLNLNFNNSAIGDYTRLKAMDDMNNANGSIISFGATPSKSFTVEREGGNGYLVKKMPKGSYNTTQSSINEGHATDLKTDHKLTIRWKLNQPVTSAIFEYKVKTNSGFDPVLGGKLPGVCGGTCPIGGTPTTDAPKDSKGNNNPNGKAIGFSARNMWRRGGNLVQYLYYPDQKTNWAPDFFYSNAAGNRIAFNDGRWHTIRHYIKMNTPGQKDGILQAWVDDVPYLSLSNVRLRDDASYGVDTALITTYFGGHDPTWATTKDEFLYFDDIKLMTND